MKVKASSGSGGGGSNIICFNQDSVLIPIGSWSDTGISASSINAIVIVNGMSPWTIFSISVSTATRIANGTSGNDFDVKVDGGTVWIKNNDGSNPRMVYYTTLAIS